MFQARRRTPTPLVYTIKERGQEVFSCKVECMRCQGSRADGKRCARKICIGTPFCFAHAQQLLGVRAKEYPGMGRGLMAIRKGPLPPKWKLGAGPRPIVFRKGEFILPYVGETLTKKEHDRRYARKSEDSAAEYVIEDGAGRFVDGACQRRIPALANTVVSRAERTAPEFAPYLGQPIKYLTSVLGGTNSKFTIRTAAHDWHGTPIPARSAWIVASKNIREGDQILTYYGGEYRIYTTPGYQKGTTRRQRLPPRKATPSPSSSSSSAPKAPAASRSAKAAAASSRSGSGSRSR
jgi:hypothetical protein